MPVVSIAISLDHFFVTPMYQFCIRCVLLIKNYIYDEGQFPRQLEVDAFRRGS